MALPPQAIEKLIRDPSHTQGAYRGLLLVSGAILGLVVVIYVGLAFGYKAYLESSLKDVESQIAKFSASVSQEDRAQIQGFYSQLVNLRTLLANHTVASPVLALLERTVQPDVYYTKLTMNANNNQAILTGTARSLEAIAAQAAAFKDQPEVDRIDFNNAGAQTGNNTWQFAMTVHLKPEIFRGVITAPPQSAPIVPPATTTAPTSTQP
ncbi:MAG: hypothetical protein A2855_00380 [Candidatus Liptonbacteria bacterium RIFCSPHIGHO2_01_FULL_57_28]|uniref:Fimbrial assembly protein n=1 Tax=Candidatus Liptonbacteria bacterium RIFCSPHIGHO2_01_FULL_57_28 TaxID=1798647 RepID=A0A1G2C8E7_9BACT|nr:MAG: hypothetical protein A2855_00380 [Candidatus Liptonbacteria bacterium RIFCSPHIGHO2_01_FULL_57_28]HLA40669.1 PilN domain-containing protein [Candidatus Glassbacteria bacterium]